MGYSDVIKHANEIQVTDALETTGDKLVLGFERPATILGFGMTVVTSGIVGGRTTAFQIALDHDPASGARVEKAVLAPGAGALALGSNFEVSDLKRGTSPAAPNAVMTPFDVVEGDLVFVEVATAGSETTGEAVFYILWAPKGSA